MGGSFNPIHNAHMVAADEAVSQFGLDEIVFVPCGVPPHKPTVELAPAEDRYLMTVIAVRDCPAYSVSRFEVDGPEPAFTIDTMRHFKKERPDAELFFITGADSIEELDTWREPEKIFEIGTLIAATRPGYTVEKAPAVAETGRLDGDSANGDIGHGYSRTHSKGFAGPAFYAAGSVRIYL